jgi:CysZ protein
MERRCFYAGTVFIAGLFVVAFGSIPIVNLAAPLFGTAFMVHVYKRLLTPSSPATGTDR